MPDTTPTIETQAAPVATPAAAPAEAAPVSSASVPVSEPQAQVVQAPEEPVEPDDGPEEDEEEEAEEMLRTEFMNLKDSLEMGQKQLKRIPHLSPDSLRKFLLMDLYPILIELADYSNWYIGDLHRRVMNVEQEVSGESETEAISPEFAEQLLNFVGMSIQIFGVILRIPKADPQLIQMAQLLTAQAPSIIAKVQEITMSDEPDEDDEDEEEGYGYEEEEEDDGAEPPEVLEPVKQGGEEVVEEKAVAAPDAPEPDPVPSHDAPIADPVEVSETKESSVQVEVVQPELVTTPVYSAPMPDKVEAPVDVTDEPASDQEKNDG